MSEPVIYLSEPIIACPPQIEEPRPEPFGYPIPEITTFRPSLNMDIWDLYAGWHDWAVSLNHNLQLLIENTGQEVGDEVLACYLRQFLLSVWELQFNGWTQSSVNDLSVSRMVHLARGKLLVKNKNSAFDVVFEKAYQIAARLERHSGLNEAMAHLRGRQAEANHSESQWAPWRWHNFSLGADILETFKGYLADEWKTATQGQRERLEQWYYNAESAQRTHLSRGCGFDIYEPFDSECVREVANFLSSELAGFSTKELVTELFNEVQFVSDFLRPKALFVTLGDLEKLTKRIVTEKTIRNRGGMPTANGKRGKAHLYCYDEIYEWWSHQNFEARLPLKCFATSILADS